MIISFEPVELMLCGRNCEYIGLSYDCYSVGSSRVGLPPPPPPILLVP